jgi:predicted GTPase
MPNGESALDSASLGDALSELAALGTERDRERLAALQDRLASARLRVLVAGEAKRGKSTLVNALLGRDVLPSGVTPLTAVTTTVRYGDDERVEVRFLDGHDEKHPLAALDDPGSSGGAGSSSTRWPWRPRRAGADGTRRLSSGGLPRSTPGSPRT